MKLSILYLLVFMNAIFSTAFAKTCDVQQVIVEQIAPDDRTIFIGKSENTDILFRNDKREGEVEAFPEPPMIIKNHRLNTECQVNEGVWLRNSIYVNDSKSLLIAEEFSGSNTVLNFYDTVSCKRRSQVDISGDSWEIKGRELLTKKIKKQGSRTYNLNNACLPIK